MSTRTTETHPLWPPCPPLPGGKKVPRYGGEEDFKILALEGQASGLNLYRAFDLASHRRCPVCGNYNDPLMDACRSCGHDISVIGTTPAIVFIYETLMAERLGKFPRMFRKGVHHPNLLSPVLAQQVQFTGEEARIHLMLPEKPAPPLADAPAPQNLLTVLRWGEQLAGGLAALHEADVVHGYIDLQHILVREDRAWLVCAPGMGGYRQHATHLDDVRGLAACLLQALARPLTLAGLEQLPQPVQKALAPVLNNTLPPESAARSMAAMLSEAHSALLLDAGRRSASAWATDPGRRRSGNEDSLLVMNLESICAGLRQPVGIYIVADGAGGHAAGEVASQTAVQVVAAQLTSQLLPALLTEPADVQKDIKSVVDTAVVEANATIQALRQVSDNNMLTTITMAVVVGHFAVVANVGDSRTYILHGGQLCQITNDHTLVQRLISTGQITSAEARSHPRRHELYRALGHDNDVKVDLFDLTLSEGDMLLLCSDGLYDELEDDHILEVLNQTTDITTATSALIDAANGAGGSDNITVVLVRPT